MRWSRTVYKTKLLALLLPCLLLMSCSLRNDNIPKPEDVESAEIMIGNLSIDEMTYESIEFHMDGSSASEAVEFHNRVSDYRSNPNINSEAWTVDITYTLVDGSVVEDSMRKIGGAELLIKFVQTHEAFIVSKTEQAPVE